MAGFVSPEMQAKLSAGGGGYTAPGVGSAGSSPGQPPPQFNPQALMQYMGAGQPSAATSFAGPARLGQPTAWNQQRPMQAQGNPFQLPGDGTTPAASMPRVPRYGEAGYGMPFNPGQPTPQRQEGGTYSMIGNRPEAAPQQQPYQPPNPTQARDPRSFGGMIYGQNMAQYQNRGPQQQGGQTWQPPINPNGVYSQSNMAQNQAAMQAALQFKRSGQQMPQGNYMNGNPGMGLYGFSGY